MVDQTRARANPGYSTSSAQLELKLLNFNMCDHWVQAQICEEPLHVYIYIL
jgi:hypothetical protein